MVPWPPTAGRTGVTKPPAPVPVPRCCDAARHAQPGPMVVAACDLPSLRPRDVSPLLDAVVSGAGAAAYRVRGRAQWSLVALSAEAVADLAEADVEPGIALGALLRPLTVLRDPHDEASVTDLDRPFRHDGRLDPPGNGHTDP